MEGFEELDWIVVRPDVGEVVLEVVNKLRWCHDQILGKLSLPIFAKIFVTSSITQDKRKEIYLFPPNSKNRGKVVTLGIGGGNVPGGTDSVYNLQPDSGLSHSSDTQRHYDTPISGASPTLPSESPTLPAPHTPPLRAGSRISEPSEGLGLGRACNAAQSQSSSPCVNIPGGLPPNEEAGVVTRGSQGQRT